MSFNYASLITDRAASDPDALRALVKKPMSQWTAAEAEAFTAATLKGSYDYTDLNRVSACMEDLVARLNGLGYQVPGYERVKIERTVKPTSRLPEGYTEVQYIQSSGTQWVDTGVKPNQDTRVIVDVDLSATSGIRAIFGGRDGDSASDNSFVFWQFSATTFRSDFDVHDLTITVESTTGRFLIDKNKTVTTINGTAYTNRAATFQPQYNVGLFSFIDPSGVDPRMSVAKMYFCKIYDDGTLVRDYVPAKTDDGEVGLYDLVTQTFYGNAGTGSFTAGAVVEWPEDVPSDSDELDPYLWYAEDAPTVAQMEQYRQNVAAIRDRIAVLAETPDTPDSMRKLTYAEANSIELILTAVDNTLIRLLQSRFYAAEVFAGEV